MTCWRVLGLARTDDVAAIRRAYATRLKALDTDRDTAGFQNLRHARDEAIRWAQSDVFTPHEVNDDGEPWGLGPADDAAPWLPEPAPDRGTNTATLDARESEAEDAADNSAWTALYDLLRPEEHELERAWPDDAQVEAMTALYDAIVTDPRMDRIDFFDRQEAWLAAVIATSWPTSAPLVGPAVEHFDWKRHADLVGDDPAVAFLVQRLRTDQFVLDLRAPYHPLRRAWVELNKPATEHSFRNPTIARGDVETLLQRIRTEFPALEDTLDPWRVALWDKARDRPTWPRTALGILIIVLINIALRLPGCNPDRATNPVVEPRSGYAGPTVQTVSDAYQQTPFARIISIVDIRDRNTPLWSDLAARFNTMRSQDASSPEIISVINSALVDHVRQVLDDPPAALLERRARFYLAHVRAARETGWDACIALVEGRATPPPLPPELTQQLDRLTAEALLVPPQPSTVRRTTAETLRIGPDITRQIRDRAGLSPEVLRDALIQEGQLSDRCEARIAAIEVALRQPPKQGEPLLRFLTR